MKPFEGVRILEFSTMITASFAAMMLAEQGASVIKVEPMELGDPMRFLGSSKGGISALFANCNRGKQSVRVDLKSDVGKDLIRELAAEADVVLCNYRPGVMDELGRHGVYSFHPVEQKWRVRRLARKVKGGRMMPDGRQGHFVERSILPGYVFAKLPGIPRWHIIRELPFISNVLGHMGRPICLKYEDLETLHELRARASAISEAEEAAAKIVFKPGDQVRVTENPALEGFVQEVMSVNASDETVFLRNLCILGKHLPVSYSQLVHV